MAKAQIVYGETAAKIIKAVEEGADGATWRAPWHFTGEASMMTPVNALTRQSYRGGNIIALWMTAEEKGYTSGYWATYKQWESIGAQVRKGERSTACVKWLVKEDKDNAKPGETKLNKKSRMIPYGFNLFAAEQVDGWEGPGEVPEGPDPITHAEDFFEAVGANVKTGYPQALYNRISDHIEIPSLPMFASAADYYATLGHEHVHWTGAESRLARTKGAHFADDAYAYEELVAEIGAAFVCARLGISNEPRPDHAQYIGSWVRQLRKDPKVLYNAASEAQKAVDFLFEAAGEKPAASEKVEVAA